MKYVWFMFIIGQLLAVPSFAQSTKIDYLTLDDVPLGAAMRLLASKSPLNIVPSEQAAKQRVSLYMEEVEPLVAVDALCRAHNLWYRQEENLLRIYTVDEYNRDINSFRTETTEVFTLLYPNSMDVGYAIHNLYPNRVLLSLGADDEQLQDDLESRLDRFSLFSQFSSNISSRGSARSSNDDDDDDDNDRGSGGISPRVRRLPQSATSRDRLTSEQIQRLETRAGEELASATQAVDKELPKANILVTVMQRHNMVIVRTGDQQAIEEIRELVRKLDVPTPMVLLQVQVLSVQLGDGFDSVFDYQFSSGDTAGAFATGAILPTLPGSLGLQGTGLINGNLTAQYVGAKFAARLQVLKNKNRVTTLATPLLLTANNEVSGLFIGDERPIVTGFTEPITIQGEGGTTTVPGSPQTDIKEVGTTLLLTPTINADRSVTIRLMQENSNISADPATILVTSGTGDIVEQSVDVVQRRTLSGTVVAQDQQSVAIGGLIEEQIEFSRRGVPILGDIPLIGILFRRESQSKSRRELVLVVRPYVLNTAAEGERLSRELLKRLSLHPERLSEDGDGSLDTYKQEDILEPEGLRRSLMTLPSESAEEAEPSDTAESTSP